MDERMTGQTPAPGEEIRLRSTTTGRGMAVVYFLFLLFMLFMGLCLLVTVPAHFDRHDPVMFRIAVVVTLVFYSFLVAALSCNMVFAWRFAKRPVVIIDSRGITDYTRIFPVGLIVWEEITEILPCEFATSSGATRRLRKENGIGIRLRNRTEFISRFGLLTRTMVRLNSWPGYFIVKSHELDLGDMDVFEFVEMLGKRFHVQVGEFRKGGDGK